ncbi:MAG: hypothetical protein Q8R53_05005 [Nanoarchaeota archaeon]|nr:hypothetical protein [Nanoarchaeota archaeon]
MTLEKIITVATVFDATPEELEQSRIPDSVQYQVCTYGYIGNQETFMQVTAGRTEGSRQKHEAYIQVYPDTGGEWTERIPSLAAKIAQETGGRIQEDDKDMVILAENPTQAQVAGWIRNWSNYFDKSKLIIIRIRYYDIPALLRRESLFSERLQINRA